MPNKANPIVAMLKADHKTVNRLFAEYKKAESRRQLAIVRAALQELEIHAELEEELIYPAIRQAIEEQDLMNEATEEHHLVHVLLAELKRLEPNDAAFKAKFTVVGELVKHHVKEEESKILPTALKTDLDWAGLYRQVVDRKKQLVAQAA